MLPCPGALLDQPTGVINRYEMIKKIVDEDTERRANEPKPPDA